MTHEDVAFFEQMRGQREAYHRLAQCIVECVPKFKNVVDVGCGLGFVLEHLIELPECDHAIGFDAPLAAESSPIGIRYRITPADLGTRFGFWRLSEEEIKIVARIGTEIRTRTFHDSDLLLISTETAEHIEEQYEAIYLDNIAGFRAPTLVFSAAPPGQFWPGHVNLKPAHHWLAELHTRGYTPIPDRTAKLRTLMRERHAQHEYCADNFFILERKS
jgi:hypothetical protein